MQSIIPMNPQTPSSEASPVQSSEKIDENSANAFRAQIGQILCRNDESGSDHSGDQTTEALSAAASSHPLRMRRDISTPSGKLKRTCIIPDLNGPDSRSLDLQNGNGACDQTAVINGAINSIDGSRLPVAAIREVMQGTKSVSGNEWADSLQGAANPSVEFPSSILDSDTNGSLKTQLVEGAGQASGQASLINSTMFQDTPIQSKSKNEEQNPGFINNLQFMRDSDYGAPQSILNGSQLNAISQARTSESSKESVLQSGSNNASQGIDWSGNLEISQNADARFENAPTAVPVSKTQNNVYGSLEEKNPQIQMDSTQPVPLISQGRFSKSAGTALQSGSNNASQGIDGSGNLGISQNADARFEKAPTAVPVSKTQNTVYGSLEEKNPQIRMDSTQPVPLISQGKIPKSEGTALQSGSNNESQRIDWSGNLEASQNDDLQIENSPKGSPSNKAQDAAVAVLESMGFGEYRTVQDAPHASPIPGIAVQGKPENALQNTNKIPTTEGDNPQEAFFAPLPSSAVRGADSGLFIGTAPEPGPAAQPNEFILQVAQRIQFQIRDGKETVRIQLKPDGLGRIEIRAETAGNGVIARIATESNLVKSYLENNLHVLQQTLQDQGLKADRIHIIVQDGLSFSTNSGYSAQFGHAGSGHSGSESHSSREISGSMIADPLEEISLDPKTWVSINPNIHFHTIA
jgi:flagellar hook-length control protein FliK